LLNRVKFKFPYIRAVLPPPREWMPYLTPCYEAGWFSNFGPAVQDFEHALTRAFCHTGEGMVSANNCTSGLAAALITVGVRGVVFFPAFTFPATPAAITMAGATAVPLDVDLDQWTIAAPTLERALRQTECDAVVLVAPFGIAQDFRAHFEICHRFGVPVVVDCAAGLGGPLAPLPHENCFEVYSLHATKVFAIGEGGAIRARAEQTERLRRALNFGLERGSADEGSWGINGKLPEISGAIGLAVLEHFDQVLARRRDFVAGYLDIFSGIPTIRIVRDKNAAPWQTFPVLFANAKESEAFHRAATEQGVEVRRYYRPALDNWARGRKIEECPNARALAERMICLPVYSNLSEEEGPELFLRIERALNLVAA
jgi:dTDP-4-amino-4,6-dideoxygalactose transaminase